MDNEHEHEQLIMKMNMNVIVMNGVKGLKNKKQA
jgi:hypothetical protein